MAKRKYSEVEMIGALKQMEAGRSAAEVGREVGVSKHRVDAWQVKLEEQGMHVNHKRVYRVYREAGLTIRRRKRKWLIRAGAARAAVTGANQEWALDFVHDAADNGRKFRVLSVIDVYTRECLALEVDTSFASRRVTRVLEQIVAERGAPAAIRCDNGPELTSRHFLAWGIERKIAVVQLEPGRPMQHGPVASCHGKLRG